VSAPDPNAAPEWAEVTALFHRALEQPEADRESFLDRACIGRPTLRAEVASLLAAHSAADAFIEQPIADVQAIFMPEAPRIHLHTGEHVGPYVIATVLGEGGMGIVYRAEDTRLGRTVALKAVAPRFSGDTIRRERLRREARAAAALSHPGIATVFALEEIDGEVYIASEYVDGETLRDEFRRARASFDTTMSTAVEIARALAAAHAMGIVHRDLKPENVMRSRAGSVKILDFGLARVPDAGAGPSLTADDARLGTPGYMAPEQLRGEPVDFRADLFAFGVLLHEMSTGVHPFSADHPAATIARILEADPPELARLRPTDSSDAPNWRALSDIAAICLKKSPAARFQSTHELVLALEAARHPITRRDTSPVVARVEPQADHTLRWWQFHQTAVSVFYLAMLVPLNYVRRSDHDPVDVALFLAGLVAALVAGTLRMHLWFTRRWYPSEWIAQRKHSAIWIRIADAGFVAIQLAAAFSIATDRPRLAALFVGAAVAALLAFTIIEPATTRAAFREPT
jgi:serine/threonine protein kinase